eukprot:scaffold824_cov327-Pavlova_lutheri.AAC.17
MRSASRLPSWPLQGAMRPLSLLRRASASAKRFSSTLESRATTHTRENAGKERPKRKRRAAVVVAWACVGVGAATYALVQVPSAAEQVQDAALYRMLPQRTASRAFGCAASVPLPTFARKWIYGGWARAFHANLDEAERSMEEYRTLREFFARKLKPGARTIEEAGPGGIVSPVDGRVMSVGKATTDGREACFEAKGRRYSIHGLLRREWEDLIDPTKQVHYLVLYLAPGDYHRIHAPCHWNVRTRRWIPGELLPVNDRAVERVPGIYVENERVILEGECETGSCAMAAIGALNVGSIGVTLEPELATNRPYRALSKGKDHIQRYGEGKGVLLKAGQEVASFNLGSTVVIVHSTTVEDGPIEFHVKHGDRIRMGQVLATQQRRQ